MMKASRALLLLALFTALQGCLSAPLKSPAEPGVWVSVQQKEFPARPVSRQSVPWNKAKRSGPAVKVFRTENRAGELYLVGTLSNPSPVVIGRHDLVQDKLSGVIKSNYGTLYRKEGRGWATVGWLKCGVRPVVPMQPESSLDYEFPTGVRFPLRRTTYRFAFGGGVSEEFEVVPY